MDKAWTGITYDWAALSMLLRWFAGDAKGVSRAFTKVSAPPPEAWN